MMLDDEGPHDDSRLKSTRSSQGILSDINHETHIYLIFAESLFHCRDFRRAEHIFERLLSFRKSCLASSSTQTTTRSTRRSQGDGSVTMTEVDVRFLLYQCCLFQNKLSAAAHVLEEIPFESRSPRIHAALGNLFCQMKNKSEAIRTLKEVIKDNPLAFEAMTSLLALGLKSTDIIAIVGPQLMSHPEQDWIFAWIDAQASLYSFKTEKSVELVKKLVSRHPSGNENKDLLVMMGQAFYYNGEYRKAINIMKPLFTKDFVFKKGLGFYASCLFHENDIQTLETITQKILSKDPQGSRLNGTLVEDSPEPWLAFGYYSFLNSKRDCKSALYFARKAYFCSLEFHRSDNLIEALLLQSRILSETKSASEGLGFLIEAHNLAPYRFEVVQALTDVYYQDRKHSLAISVAANSLKHFGQTSRALTLYATALLNESDDGKKTASSEKNRKSAKSQLERAVLKDRSYLKATYKLAELYIEEKLFTRAIDLINKCLEHENTNKLHRLLGDCYTRIGDAAKAEHHLNTAKKLEVTYRSSTEAAQSLNSSHSHHPSTAGTNRGAASSPPIALGHDLVDVSDDGEDMEYGEADHASDQDF